MDARFAWAILLASAVLEAVWATALGLSDGFSQALPTMVFAVTATLSMIGLGIAVKRIPLGTAYAVWVGIGAALTVGWAMATGVEPASPLKLLFIAGIVGCAAGLKALPTEKREEVAEPGSFEKSTGILPRSPELPANETNTRRRRSTMSPETTNVQLGDRLTVSPLGFGGMALTPVYGEVDPAESLKTLHHAVDAGISFIDTADIYGAGDNEELIAKLLKDRRDEVQLATKFGIVGNPREGYTDVRGDTAYVAQAAEASLRRLGTDVIDLYYMHRRDLRVPIVETVEAMAELVRAGKVRHLGLSEVTAEELREANAVHPIAAVQSEWSIWSRDVERSVVPTAAELGVGFVPYSPLGRGFLTGTVSADQLGENDFRHRIPRFADGALDANQAVVAAVRAVAAELSESTGRDATPAQVALAWLFAQGRRLQLSVVPIPGTRKAHRIDENLGALSLELSAAQLDVLDGAADAVVGSRSADPTWVSQGRE